VDFTEEFEVTGETALLSLSDAMPAYIVEPAPCTVVTCRPELGNYACFDRTTATQMELRDSHLVGDELQPGEADPIEYYSQLAFFSPNGVIACLVDLEGQ
jgi:hypothetical protein